jgi:hypothetical protein
MNQFANSITSATSIVRNRETASGALRRELVGTIHEMVRAFSATLNVLARPMYARETCFAGPIGWRFFDASMSGFCAFRTTTSEGRSRPHSWTGTEIWVTTTGDLYEADVAGWYGGLACSGDAVEEETRTFSRIGAREVAKRFGIDFVKSFQGRLDDAVREAEGTIDVMESDIALLQRVRAALRS